MTQTPCWPPSPFVPLWKTQSGWWLFLRLALPSLPTTITKSWPLQTPEALPPPSPGGKGLTQAPMRCFCFIVLGS